MRLANSRVKDADLKCRRYEKRPHTLLRAALDGKNLLHNPVSDAEHAVMQVDGSIVIVHEQFEGVADLDGNFAFQHFDGCMFGVQRFDPQPWLALDRGQAALAADGLYSRVDNHPFARRFADNGGEHGQRDLELRSGRRIPGVHQKVGTCLDLGDTRVRAGDGKVTRAAARDDFHRDSGAFQALPCVRQHQHGRGYGALLVRAGRQRLQVAFVSHQAPEFQAFA